MNKKCQVFTPRNNVVELLDRVGYIKNLFGSKVIENACGDGSILVVIVERYIEDCLELDFKLDTIKIGLETDIYGAEIDTNHYKQCIKNLNYTSEKYGIFSVKWNILNVDILKTALPVKFDYVIGNPPYITYRDLDEETRIYLKEHYEVCAQGKFDYCYAFIEASLKCLNDTGKLSYLIPSSILKNVFGKKLREFMLPMLNSIYDYKTKKLFSNALTSSSIIIANKGKLTDVVEYFNEDENLFFYVNKKILTDKWVFNESIIKDNVKKHKFSDFFTASITIATLLNEAFVVRNYTEENEYINVRNYKIEKRILRETVSPRSLSLIKKELIIFPYYYESGNLMKYEEKDFIEKFPKATEYLKKNSDKLAKRKASNGVHWYEYGRTQALSRINQEKLLTSTVVTKTVKVYELSRKCIPYSGIFIVSKGVLPLSVARNILESKSFYNYVQNIGINASGSSMRITAQDINNYEFLGHEVL